MGVARQPHSSSTAIPPGSLKGGSTEERAARLCPQCHSQSVSPLFRAIGRGLAAADVACGKPERHPRLVQCVPFHGLLGNSPKTYVGLGDDDGVLFLFIYSQHLSEPAYPAVQSSVFFMIPKPVSIASLPQDPCAHLLPGTYYRGGDFFWD